jgi:hypothetical protein
MKTLIGITAITLTVLICSFGASSAQYVPPDNRPYVTFIDENGCPIQFDQGGGFQYLNVVASTLPAKLFFKGIVHITPGYCYPQQPGEDPFCFTCYDLKIDVKYNTDGEDTFFWENVTDGQIIYFAVDTSKINKLLPPGSNLADCGVTFYQCDSNEFAQPPQGLNINQCTDYACCEPKTLITLSSFTAKPGNGSVTLNWATETEIDNVGFNILRATAEDGVYVKINAELIPAQGGAAQGAAYQFVDTNVRNRKTYYYKLEDIDLNGTATAHGPVSATPKWMYAIFK